MLGSGPGAKSATAAPALQAASSPVRPCLVDLRPRLFCARTCLGYRHRVRRDPGGENVTGGRATNDPRALQDDAAVLQFTASGRRASVEDMARMECPQNRATAMLASGLKMTCECIEALRAATAPKGDQSVALDEQRLLAVPWSAVQVKKAMMPAALASSLNRDMAGRVKRTTHIKSIPTDFVHDSVVEEDVDAHTA